MIPGCAPNLGSASKVDEGVPDRREQQRGHRGDILAPQRIEVVGNGEDDMVMIAGEEAGALRRQPALDLDERALWTGPMPTGVVPDARHMAVRAGLDMTTEGRRSALHDGPGRFADVRRQGMRLLVGRIRVLKNGLECEGKPSVLHPCGIGLVSYAFYDITPTIPATSGSSNH